jgi:hypothetical protein
MACALVLAVTAAQGAEVECVERWTDQNAPRWPSEPRPTSKNCDGAMIRGTIVRGDFEKVLSLYRENHPYLANFDLVSPGGDVDEAMKIGRLFRKYLVHVRAPYRLTSGEEAASFMPGECKDCVCASACALIWFGAPERYGTVGLHRPYYCLG